MIFIVHNNETSTRARVIGEHHMPELLTQEELSKGILVESLPPIIQQAGKIEQLYINPTTNELWYEYVDRPLTEKEEIEKLKQENVTMQDTINFLLGL